jgi:hypothetical protein
MQAAFSTGQRTTAAPLNLADATRHGWRVATSAVSCVFHAALNADYARCTMAIRLVVKKYCRNRQHGALGMKGAPGMKKEHLDEKRA